MVILVLLAGPSVAQGGDSAGTTGTTGSSGARASGGETKSPGSTSTTAKAGGAKGAGDGKATGSPVLAPLTGSPGSIYAGGWSGLGGGFTGDFGPQYNTYPCGFGMESVNMYGPLGMFGQYGMYGPFGMFGPSGPSFGSSLGFGGFGAHDPWALYKQANIGWAEQARSMAAMTGAQQATSGVKETDKPATPAKTTTTSTTKTTAEAPQSAAA